MIKVIDPGPHHSVVKEVICRNCGAKLKYAPVDVESKRVSCMGDVEVVYFIKCPCCGNDVSVR